MVLKVEELDILQMAEDLADKLWFACTQMDFFARDTVGKQLVKAADSISANLAEGHGRYHFNDRLQFCYYARGSLEETKSWIGKAVRRGLFRDGTNEIDELVETLPRRLNAYIRSIRRARTKSSSSNGNRLR